MKNRVLKNVFGRVRVDSGTLLNTLEHSGIWNLI